MVMAQLSYDQLSPMARQEADRLIALLAEEPPRVRSFVPAATWLDALKRVQPASPFAAETWHFVNLPSPAPELHPTLPATDHIVTALEAQLVILRNRQAPERERALALRVVLHLVGDAHQPLHCINRTSAAAPSGDLGGNALKIVWPADPNASLHLLWDDALGLYPAIPVGTDWQPIIVPAARELGQLFPRERLPQAAQLQPETWVRESYDLALEVAYPGVEPGQAPSAAYLERGRQVAKERLALAAYRLANLLEAALGPEKAP